MTFPRASGILLHPTSLPSLHGIGDLGKAAYEFVDFLERSGQKLWQVLPLGPTTEEHSPYIMNFSTFGGNPLLISLEQLVQDGLLSTEEVVPLENADADRVDFDRVIPHKMRFLKLANDRFQKALATQSRPEFEKFCREQAYWLDDYVLFMALYEASGHQPWNQWERSLAHREPEALKQAAVAHQATIDFYKFAQFIFFEQWKQLRRYANQKQIQIIGDVSIYVCFNSADVWASPSNFKLAEETFEPLYIAGVPPDYFSETGQLWGNPVYSWDNLQKTGYDWWIRRFKATLEYVDIVRIDHFRGFEAYWQVPAGEKNAIRGEWIKAPGVEFFETLGSRLGTLPVMAEDLGIITPEVEELRDRFQFPGMRILQFAFAEDAKSIHLPHHHTPNSVVYTGTHDNDTAIGWWQSASDREKQFFAHYLGYTDPAQIQNFSWVFIRLALASVANQAILPLQDVLGLDSRGRMNDPSTNAGNWRWRYRSSELLTAQLSQKLRELTQMYDR